MKLIDLFIRFLIGVLTSFYLFPINIRGLGYMNTKTIMAGVGLFVIAIELSKRRKVNFIDKDILNLLIFALLVTLPGRFSVIFNNTTDTSYSAYIISASVWLSAAFVPTCCMRYYHKGLSIQIVTYYLIGVCTAQCFFALCIDYSPAFANFVDRFIDYGKSTYENTGRLYSIGAALDPSGQRFGACLLVFAFQIIREYRLKYVFAFIFLYMFNLIVGNMIARTTTVGASIGIGVMILHFILNKDNHFIIKQQLKPIILTIILCTGCAITLYNTDAQMRANMRYGFEGFFNYFEKGNFETGSTNILKTMYIWPDNPKTWIIGDGYFDGAYNNPYYTGVNRKGYYMNTDVGYCRFIFYHGIIGLTAFIIYFIYAGYIGSRRYPKYKYMFWLLVALNFIHWAKVATDIFLIFAILFMVSKKEQEEYEDKHGKNEDLYDEDCEQYFGNNKRNEKEDNYDNQRSSLPNLTAL